MVINKKVTKVQKFSILPVTQEHLQVQWHISQLHVLGLQI